MAQLTTAVFDLGGVVLRWDPRPPYAGAATPEEIERFFDEVQWRDWNRSLDAGRSWAEAEADLVTRFPHWAHLAPVYRVNFARSVLGEVAGTAAVLDRLRSAGVRLLALTNWAAETFALIRGRFPVLDSFEAILVSGAEGLIKPDPAIFRLLCDRFAVDPAEAVFIDDSPANVVAADGVGLHGLHFTDATALQADLVRLGLVSA